MAKDDIKEYEFTSDQSRTEAARNGQKGGIISGKKRKEKRLMRDALSDLMKMQVTDENIIQTLEDMGIENKDNQTALVVGIFLKALRGDVRAGEFIRDTMGEKPVDVVQQLDPPVFVDDIK